MARKRGLQFCRLCFQNLFCYLWEYSSQMIRVFSKNTHQIRYSCSKISPWVESSNTEPISSNYHFFWSTLHARVTSINVNVITKTLYFPPDFNIIQLWWEANNLIWMRCNEGPILVVRLVARDSKKAFTCKLKTIFSADFIAFIFQNMYLHFFT